MDLSEFFQEGAIYLVVGAGNNMEKYGARVFADLKSAGFGVIAINSRIGGQEEIQGTPSYQSITGFFERVIELFDEQRKHDAIEKIVVVFVVPPEAALEVLHEAVDHGITKAWFQPGSESDEALSYCKENGVAVMHDACIMVLR